MRYDEAFANAKYIPGGADYPARWVAKAEAFRASLGDRAQLGLRYGPDAAEWFDLFLPDGSPEGVVIFIHGGYWLSFGPRDFSHLAAGAVGHGWAVAMAAYTLAPKAPISVMTGQIARAIQIIAREVEGPIVISGHSAGGHLAARMASADVALPPEVLSRIRRVVPVSPVADLRPLMETAMNADLHIDVRTAQTESPVLLAPRPGIKVHAWVGGAERPAFLDQARRLGNAWACPVTVEPGRHHFDVIEGLERAESPLIGCLLA
jgi:acetyl esterase/lipase